MEEEEKIKPVIINGKEYFDIMEMAKDKVNKEALNQARLDERKDIIKYIKKRIKYLRQVYDPNGYTRRAIFELEKIEEELLGGEER